MPITWVDANLADLEWQVRQAVMQESQGSIQVMIQVSIEGDGYGYHVGHGPHRLRVQMDGGKPRYANLPDRMASSENYDEDLGEKEIWNEFNERVAEDVHTYAQKLKGKLTKDH